MREWRAHNETPIEWHVERKTHQFQCCSTETEFSLSENQMEKTTQANQPSWRYCFGESSWEEMLNSLSGTTSLSFTYLFNIICIMIMISLICSWLASQRWAGSIVISFSLFCIICLLLCIVIRGVQSILVADAQNVRFSVYWSRVGGVGRFSGGGVIYRCCCDGCISSLASLSSLEVSLVIQPRSIGSCRFVPQKYLLYHSFRAWSTHSLLNRMKLSLCLVTVCHPWSCCYRCMKYSFFAKPDGAVIVIAWSTRSLLNRMKLSLSVVVAVLFAAMELVMMKLSLHEVLVLC